MDGLDYQQLAARTLIDKPDFEITNTQMMVIWNAIGLAGEAGEVAELVKKGIFHQHGLEEEKVRKELGDVMWYVAAIATTLDLDLSLIMRDNIEKLKERYPNGYTSERSIARTDTKKGKNGADLIREERQRQIEEEGWTKFHDDSQVYCELAKAAAYYALPSWEEKTVHWPFEKEWNKKRKHSRIRQLVIAGAFIAAEIDRLKRQGVEE